MIIGRRIRRLRREQGIAQGNLAKRVDCSQSHLCDIERGRRSPGLPLARRIAAALHTTVDDLTRSASLGMEDRHLTTGGRGRRAAKGGGNGRALKPRARAAGKAG